MTSRRDERDAPPADWLDGAVGYVVESGIGRLGRLEDVRRDPESGRPVALVVHAGSVAWRRLVIPVEDVAGVLPGSRRIVVDGGRASSAAA